MTIGTDGDLVLHHADFLHVPIGERSVDLIVTSPPYNLAMPYTHYNDAGSYPAYLAFSETWLARAWRTLKDDGRLCLNLPLDKVKGGMHSVAADVTVLAQRVGFQYRTTILWNKGSPTRRCAWGTYGSAAAPHVLTPVEVIVVLFKHAWKKQHAGTSDITATEFRSWTNGVWTFPGQRRKRAGHPAPFPPELPTRCLKLFSYVGETVLDPFVGSGTTLVVCRALARRGVGVEIDRGYCDLARRRIQDECEPVFSDPAASRDAARAEVNHIISSLASPKRRGPIHPRGNHSTYRHRRLPPA